MIKAEIQCQQMYEMPENFRSSISFLRTELETGLTFAWIAEQARDEHKINRNRENARKACQSARYFMDRISLPDNESAELQVKLEQLEHRLERLDSLVS